MPAKKPRTKAPASHIIRHEDEEAFLKEVTEYFEKGYRPLHEMMTFAELDPKNGKWRTLFVMPVVHYEEFKEFQTVPPGEDDKEESMFG